jgi:hypothetical protein
MMRLKVRRLGEGLHPSEMFVSVETKDGPQDLAVHPSSIHSNTVIVGWPVGRKGRYLLVELPRPTSTGTRRVWVSSRTSTTFFTPAFKRRSKNPSAVVFVNPIVETVALATIVTPPRSGHRGQAVVQQTRPSARVRDTRLRVVRTVGQKGRQCCALKVREAFPRCWRGSQHCHCPGYGSRGRRAGPAWWG